MSSMPTIHIIDLPDDVLLLIAELLPKADLAKLLRVNFKFHRIGLAVLLKLQSPVDFMTTRPSVVIQPSDPFFFINSCFFSKDYALQVHSVTVPPHGRHWCSPFKVPDMPNVDVIRLKLAERFPDEPCWRTIHSDVPPPMVFFGDCPQDNWCPLLDIPSAKTLVIVETHSFQTGIKGLLPAATARTLSSTVLFLKAHQCHAARAVDSIVNIVNVDSLDSIDEPWEPHKGIQWEHLSRFMPDSLESFTLVFESPQLTPYGSVGFSEELAYGRRLMNPAHKLLTVICDLCDDLGHSGKTVAILPKSLETFTIVVVPDGVLSEECRTYLQNQISLKVEQHRKQRTLAVSKSPIQEQLSAWLSQLGQGRIPTVRILTMSHLMSRNEYAGVMTKEEREKWSARANLPHYTMSISEVQGCVDQSEAGKGRKAAR